MNRALCLVLVLIAAPALAQSHVYTAADLDQPRQHRVTVTAEQLASMVAHQFHAPLELTGPQVIIIGTASEIAGTTFAGPFGAFPPIPPPRRLDGTSFDVPAWSVGTYLGYPYGGPAYANLDTFGGPGRIGTRAGRPDHHRFSRDVPARPTAPIPGRVVPNGGGVGIGRRVQVF